MQQEEEAESSEESESDENAEASEGEYDSEPDSILSDGVSTRCSVSTAMS
jgi:hypothetical protein